jgi:hypothetical protein
MRRQESQPKRAISPCELEQQLRWYALAAAATGVGILASQPSDAEIVYTKAHQRITPNTITKLDLNHDGIVDFSLKDTHSSNNSNAYGRLSVLPVGRKDQIGGHVVSRRAYASALFAGVRVGPKGQFLPAAGTMAETVFSGGIGFCTGPWGQVKNRYLGLKFLIAGKVHFGWARLNVTCPWDTFTVTGLLTGYAYETVPNRPIVTGKEKGSDDIDMNSQQDSKSSALGTFQPASLGRLAQGAAGLTAWRRKQRKENGR